jgi:hypothetical protein
MNSNFRDRCFLENEDGWDMDEVRHSRLSLDQQIDLAQCCKDCAFVILNNMYGVVPAVLHMLTQYGDEGIDEAIALNPDTLPTTLRSLAYSDSEYIRITVAQHPNTQAPVLEELAVGGLAGVDDPKILQAVMENQNCPDELAGQILFKLSVC